MHQLQMEKVKMPDSNLISPAERRTLHGEQRKAVYILWKNLHRSNICLLHKRIKTIRDDNPLRYRHQQLLATLGRTTCT